MTNADTITAATSIDTAATSTAPAITDGATSTAHTPYCDTVEVPRGDLEALARSVEGLECNLCALRDVLDDMMLAYGGADTNAASLAAVAVLAVEALTSRASKVVANAYILAED